MSAQAKILKKKLKKEKKRVKRLRRQQRQLHCDATDYMNAVVAQTVQDELERSFGWKLVRWGRGNLFLVASLAVLLAVIACVCFFFRDIGPKVTLILLVAGLAGGLVYGLVHSGFNPRNHRGQQN